MSIITIPVMYCNTFFSNCNMLRTLCTFNRYLFSFCSALIKNKYDLFFLQKTVIFFSFQLRTQFLFTIVINQKISLFYRHSIFKSVLIQETDTKMSSIHKPFLRKKKKKHRPHLGLSHL